MSELPLQQEHEDLNIPEFENITKQNENIPIKDTMKLLNLRDSIHQISFDDIDPKHLSFSFSYKCAKSTVGQIIAGLYHLSQYISGEGQYVNNKKEVKNEYQKHLYPEIIKLSTLVVDEYEKTFMTDIEIKRQVFGANLNGLHNDGQLNHFIPVKGIYKHLRFQYAQFRPLINLLIHRLKFIVNRNADNILRYTTNQNEMKYFLELQLRADAFCQFLRDNILSEWIKYVDDARSNQPTSDHQLTNDNVEMHNADNHNTSYRHYGYNAKRTSYRN